MRWSPAHSTIETSPSRGVVLAVRAPAARPALGSSWTRERYSALVCFSLQPSIPPVIDSFPKPLGRPMGRLACRFWLFSFNPASQAESEGESLPNLCSAKRPMSYRGAVDVLPSPTSRGEGYVAGARHNTTVICVEYSLLSPCRIWYSPIPGHMAAWG